MNLFETRKHWFINGVKRINFARYIFWKQVSWSGLKDDSLYLLVIFADDTYRKLIPSLGFEDSKVLHHFGWSKWVGRGSRCWCRAVWEGLFVLKVSLLSGWREAACCIIIMYELYREYSNEACTQLCHWS